MSVIHIDDAPDHCEVWLDQIEAWRFDGVVLGVGRTRAEALDAADVNLLAALDAVRTERKNAGVTTTTIGGSMNDEQATQTEDTTPAETPAETPASDQGDGAASETASDEVAPV